MKKRFTILLSIVMLLLLQVLTYEVNCQVVGTGSSKEIASGGNIFQFKTIVRKKTSDSVETPNTKTISAKTKQTVKNSKIATKTTSKQVSTAKNSKNSKQNVDEKEDVEVGKIINLPKPQYPKAAAAVGVKGKVEVSVTIDEEGNVIEAEAISGHPLLHSAAIESAKQAKFTPTLLNKQPVMVTGVLVYNFTK